MEKSWKYRSVIQKGIAVYPKYVWIVGKPKEESEAVERLLEPLRNKDGTFSYGYKTMPGYLPLACVRISPYWDLIIKNGHYMMEYQEKRGNREMASQSACVGMGGL